MTHTRNKLSEAEYFLNCMKCYDAKPAVFRYNLSAFLCAFKSIHYIMLEDFESGQASKYKGQRFETWKNLLKAQICQDAKVVLLCNVRNENIHERPTQLAFYVEVTEVVKLRISEKVHLDITHSDGTTEHVIFPSSSSEDTWGSSEPSNARPPTLCFDITQDVKNRIIAWLYCKKQLKNTLLKDVDALRETPAIDICQDGLSTLEGIVADCEKRFPI